jgi:hypothetical protein
MDKIADLVAAQSPSDLLSVVGLVVAGIAIASGIVVFVIVCWICARARVEHGLSALGK